MFFKLKEIAEIRTGFTVRKTLKNNSDGDVDVIQMKDVKDDFSGFGNSLIKLSSSEINHKHFLEKGDILMMAKGNHNSCVLFNSNKKAAAVSLFYVISPDKNKVIPEYLNWFLMLDDTQAKLKSLRNFGSVSNLIKADLGDLKVKLPDLKKQEIISKINLLNLKEKKLNSILLEKKNVIINEYLKAL